MNGRSTILLVCNTFPPSIGGVGEYVYNLVEFLKNKYNFMIVTSLDNTKPSHEANTRYREKTSILNTSMVFKVGKLPRSLPYITTFPLVVKSYEFFKKKDLNIRLIHTNSIGQVHSDMLTLLSYRKLPVVYTVHSWRNAENIIASKLYRIYESTIARLVLKKADVVTVLGNRSKDYLRSILGHDFDFYKEKIMITPNGVDFRKIRRIIEKSRANKGHNIKKEVLYAGRLTNTKGIFDLLISFHILSKIEKDATLTIVGEGPLKRQIINFISKRELENRVKFVGRVPRHKLLAEYFAEASLLVLPSYSEGMPTVVLEAMASEIPVVATNVGEIPDIICHEETGMLVKPGDIKGLADAMLILLNDNDLRKKIISNSLNMIKKYDWPVIAENFDRIYRSLQK